nr:hypothetical protein BdHM001_35050 [Bdellovibrio sp. HM001]
MSENKQDQRPHNEMVVEYVRAENLYSYPFLDLVEKQLNPDSVQAILGYNKDGKTSNAAGKSGIFKIVYYAITGEELNDAALDKITYDKVRPNKGMSEGHCVEIGLRCGPRKFVIRRMRGYTPSHTSIFNDHAVALPKKRNNTLTAFWVDGEQIKAESETKLKRLILETLKVNPEIFKIAALIKQNAGSPFLQAKDSEKKEVLARIIGLGEYDDYWESAKKDRSDLENKISILETRVKERERLIEKLSTSDINELKRKQAEYHQKKAESLAKYRAEYSELSAKIKAVEASAPKLTDTSESVAKIEGLRAKLESCAAKIAALEKGSVDRESELNREKVELTNGLKGSASQKASIEATLKELQKTLATLSPYESKLREAEENPLYAMEVAPDLDSRVTGLRSQRSEMEKSLSAKEQTIKDDRETLEDLVHSMDCPTCKRPWDEQTLAEKRERISRIEGRINAATETVAELKQSISKIDDLWAVAQKELQARDHKAATEQIRKKVEEASVKAGELETNKQALNEATEAISRYESLIVAIDAKIAEEKSSRSLATKELRDEESVVRAQLTEAEKELSTIIEKNRSVEESARSLQALKEALNSVTKLGQELKDEKDQYVDLLEAKEVEIREAKDGVLELNNRIAETKASLADVNFWVEAYSPTGIRSFLTEDSLGILNEVTNVILDKVYFGILRVKFEPSSESAKGVVTNKISTHYFRDGIQTEESLISGGELRRVEYAVNLAIAKIAEMFMPVKFRTKWMDEPFSGMDGEAEVLCLQALREISNETGTGFQIISHNGVFQSMCSSTLSVQKIKGASQILSDETAEGLATKARAI